MSFESFYKRRLTHSTNTKIKTEALPKRCASLKECIYRANLVNSIDLHSPKLRPTLACVAKHHDPHRRQCVLLDQSSGRVALAQILVGIILGQAEEHKENSRLASRGLSAVEIR